MKYMVMECHPAFAVVLDEDGRFLKVANMHYEVGETVTEVIEMKAPPKKKKHRWVYSLTAAAACLLLVVSFFFQTGQAAYASVYLTINPEIRIDVDKKDIVMGLEAINEDGTALLSGYDYQKKELNVVMDELVDRAIEMDYLRDGGTVSLKLDAKDQTWIASHKESMGADLERHLTQKLTVTVEITTPVEKTSTETEEWEDDMDDAEDDDVEDDDVEDKEPEDSDKQHKSDDDKDDLDDSDDREDAEEDQEEEDSKQTDPEKGDSEEEDDQEEPEHESEDEETDEEEDD